MPVWTARRAISTVFDSSNFQPFGHGAWMWRNVGPLTLSALRTLFIRSSGKATDDELGGVLGEELLALRDGLARRRERGVAALRRGGRRLDARVGVRLVVVADEQHVVAAVHQRRHGLEPDVGRAPVAGHHDDVRQLALPGARPDPDLVGGLYAAGDGAAVGDLRVDPWNPVGRAQVAGVRHVHAAGGAEEDGVRT